VRSASAPRPGNDAPGRGEIGSLAGSVIARPHLDMTLLGRQGDCEEPKGRVAPVRGGDPTFTS
jgi:hypothetical protein